MSFVIIPLFTLKPPNITNRWWIQLLGHVYFVGLPITWSFSRQAGRGSGTPSNRLA